MQSGHTQKIQKLTCNTRYWVSAIDKKLFKKSASDKDHIVPLDGVAADMYQNCHIKNNHFCSIVDWATIFSHLRQRLFVVNRFYIMCYTWARYNCRTWGWLFYSLFSSSRKGNDVSWCVRSSPKRSSAGDCLVFAYGVSMWTGNGLFVPLYCPRSLSLEGSFVLPLRPARLTIDEMGPLWYGSRH